MGGGEEMSMEAGTFYIHIALAIVSALTGLFHVVYCCLFFTSGVGIWNAAILLLTGFYGLCQHKPGAKFMVYTHLILLMAGSASVILNGMGLHCTFRKCSVQGWSRPAMERCLYKFRDSDRTFALLGGMAQIHVTIHALLLIQGAVEIIVSVGVIWRQLFSFADAVKDDINIYYGQMLLGLLALSFGSVHTLYCAHTFYLGIGVWASLLIILAGLYRNTPSANLFPTNGGKHSSEYFPPPGSQEESFSRGTFLRHRLIGWLAVISSALLLFVGCYGCFCWDPVTRTLDSVDWGNGTAWRGCEAPSFAPNTYQHCYQRLESFGYWAHSSDPHKTSIAKLQQGMSLCLVLTGLCSLIVALFVETKFAKACFHLKLHRSIPSPTQL